MAKFSYDVYKKTANNQSGGNERIKVGYFNSLKNDGDEAIVRFAYSSPTQFDLVTGHKVQVDGHYRFVSCLRDAHDPVGKCPLCEQGEKIQCKFFVKLIEYTRDENGNIVATPKVWERPSSFANLLESCFNEYGDISDCIFKVKRRGAKGDLKTSYDVLFANPTVYKPEIYVKDFSGFETLDLAHHSYMEKTADEMREFLETGSFPQKAKKADASAEEAPASKATPVEEQIYTRPTYTTPTEESAVGARRPQATSDEEPVQRPKRYTMAY